MASVRLEHVSRHYGGVRAVDDVDLEVAAGEFVTLLGPSGCGKTTTLRMVAGLEQNTGGRIAIGDQVVSDAERGLFVAPERRRIGMVFQSYAIWPHMSVAENVAYPLTIRRRPAAEIAERVAKALDLVEMGHLGQRPAPALSGGQQQRVAIARALVFEPALLLLDEPLSNLDARLRLQMGDDFRALQQRLGLTALYVTHDQAEAMSLSDRVVVMGAGRIRQIGRPEAIYRRPESREVAAFFGQPNFLDATVRACRPDRDAFLLDVAGSGWGGACRAPTAFAPGAAVTVIVRPEDLRIAEIAGRPDAEAGNALADAALRWTGQVRQSIYRGPSRSLVVGTEVGDLNVTASALLEPAPGDRVTVSAPAVAAWAIRRDPLG